MQALPRRKKISDASRRASFIFEITSSSMYALNDLNVKQSLPDRYVRLEIKRANARSDGRI